MRSSIRWGELEMSVLSSTKAEQKLALISGRKCDKYDYLIAVGCGAAAGLVDIFLVGAPKGAMVSNDSVLGKWIIPSKQAFLMVCFISLSNLARSGNQ